MFKNDDVNPDKSIKKKRFLDPDNISEMVECVGEVEDWELEFEQLDVQKRGKVSTQSVHSGSRTYRQMKIFKNKAKAIISVSNSWS